MRAKGFSNAKPFTHEEVDAAIRAAIRDQGLTMADIDDILDGELRIKLRSGVFGLGFSSREELEQLIREVHEESPAK